MSLSQVLFSQNWLLSFIFLLLGLISMVSWYIIFRKILFFKKEQQAVLNFKPNERHKSLTQDNNQESKTTQVLKQALKILHQDHSSYSKITEKKLNLLFEGLKDHYNFGQNFLASIANLAPFIGLFGTVIGVYLALIDISAQGNANIAVVARPIGEALIATAIGLWCAIPASFAFNFFNKKSSSMLKKAKLLVEEEIIKIEEGLK